MAEGITRRALFGGLRSGSAARAAILAPSDVVPAPETLRIASVSAACLESHGTSCRLCGDVCDARAIGFRPRLGGGAAISIDAAACTGCGDCLPTCPTGAITLMAHSNGASS